MIRSFYNVCRIVGLLVFECYDIGRVAYANKDFYHTLMWMQEALDRFDQENNDSSLSKIDILDHLANATSQVNDSIINSVFFLRQ